ncbi:Hypothetical predicted protein, partial [Olea europaea subsp. europaea]
MEAPTKDPNVGKAAMALLVGVGAGASLGAVAMAALMEAAAMRAAHAIFFISMVVAEEDEIR